MTNKFATVLCACLIAIAAMAHAVRAEEYEDVPVDPPIETVEETPAPEDPVSDAQGPARVPVEIDAAALAEALTEALATPTPDPDAEPTPEPTPRIIVIQATPETAPTPEPTEAPHDLGQAVQRLHAHRGLAAAHIRGAVLSGAADLVEVIPW